MAKPCSRWRPMNTSEAVAAMVDEGVSVVGGCCGTNPDYIAKEAALVAGRAPVERDVAPRAALRRRAMPRFWLAATLQPLASASTLRAKRLKAALREGNLDYVLGEAVSRRRRAPMRLT